MSPVIPAPYLPPSLATIPGATPSPAAPEAWLVQEVPQGGAAPEGEGAAPGSPFGGLMVPLLLMVVIFWVLVIGPERKLRKKRDAMLRELEKGDRVVTTGGMHGQIVQVQDQLVTLQIAEGVRVKFSRSAIQGVVEEPGEAAKDAGKDAGKDGGRDAPKDGAKGGAKAG